MVGFSNIRIYMPVLEVIWEYDSNMNLRGIGWECLNRINLAQDVDCLWAVMKTVMNFLIP